MGSRISRRDLLVGTAISTVGMTAPAIRRPADAAAPVLSTIVDTRFTARVVDPRSIPQFVAPCPMPGRDNWEIVDATRLWSVDLKTVETTVEVVQGYSTKVWAYRRKGGATYSSTYLGPTLSTRRDWPMRLRIDYGSLSPAGLPHVLRRGADPSRSVIDPTLHGAELGKPERRFALHLHGGRDVRPQYDGYPESWVTPTGVAGPTRVPLERYGAVVNHIFPNSQPGSLIWYHDHALGVTRLNVQAGLAGAYIINDPNEALIPSGYAAYPQLYLVIQDRMFYQRNGLLDLAFPDSPADAPTWPGGPSVPVEYFGDVMLVNGRAWPYLDVQPQRYRLRILNGCDSRVLRLSLTAGLTFKVLGMEGDRLSGGRAPVAIREVILGPAERLDAVVDFSFNRGQRITMLNTAAKPFPGGDPVDPTTDGRVMQFRIGAAAVIDKTPPFTTLRLNGATVPTPAATTPIRSVLLFEAADKYGRVVTLLGSVDPRNQTGTAALWSQEPPTERPVRGVPEYWDIYNTTEDTHPVHVHDVLFRVVSRQPFSFTVNPIVADQHVLPPGPHVTGIARQGSAVSPPAWESGLKDTVLAPPGQITRIAVVFNTAGRFVWHCHLLEHEDNEMMRPLDCVASGASLATAVSARPEDLPFSPICSSPIPTSI